MENEKFDEITMRENVESKNVAKRYHEALDDTRAMVLIPLVFFIISIIAFIASLAGGDIYTVDIFLIFAIISFVILMVCRRIRKNKIAFYEDLYRVARKNDAIRHDEKVRYLERKRLEQKYNNSFNAKNIKETLDYPKELK